MLTRRKTGLSFAALPLSITMLFKCLIAWFLKRANPYNDRGRAIPSLIHCDLFGFAERILKSLRFGVFDQGQVVRKLNNQLEWLSNH